MEQKKKKEEKEKKEENRAVSCYIETVTIVCLFITGRFSWSFMDEMTLHLAVFWRYTALGIINFVLNFLSCVFEEAILGY